MSLSELEPFVGEWSTEASLAPGLAGRTVFEWALGGAYLLQRSEIPHPQAPDGLCVIARDGNAYTQHYFDSRGVTRLYAMSFDPADGRWTLLRERADFSPLDFAQRWTGIFNADRTAIEGRWESAREPGAWELDFELSYMRVS